MLSQKPYFIRAIYEWCSDNNFTPFIATTIDERTQIPNQYADQGQMVLNIAFDATKDLLIDNEWITFKATFGGTIHDVALPITNILAIFAQENGQGMQFNAEAETQPEESPQPKAKKGGLKLVK
jgi:stringent starvation protein B